MVFPEHPEFPEISRGTDDVTWLQIAGAQRWIVVSREPCIRTRPAELEAYRSFGVRSVWIGGRVDLRSDQLVELFLRQECVLAGWHIASVRDRGL